MKIKIHFRFSWLIIFFATLFCGCTDLELKEKTKLPDQDFDSSSRSILEKLVRDSTINAERLVVKSSSSTEAQTLSSQQITALSPNYALQATVSAESTFSGYSVLKIKDGSRTTTVGPAYSWTNNFTGGGKLPESVFLKFTSLKTVDRIDIYTSSGYAMQNYTIQYRVTATGSWMNVLVVTGNTSTLRSHTFPQIAALEIRIICQLGPANQTIYGRLNEVEIYGPAEPTLPAISVQNGMLVLGSTTDVTQAIDYLEFKYEQYTDAFLAQYSSLTDDQLSEVEDLTGFNDEKPFIDFENQYGISSLRSQLTAAEDNWLATTTGDETAGPDPDDLYNIDEYELRTLINANGEIKVGGIFYVFLSDGSYYTYTGDPMQVSLLKNRAKDQPLPVNVIYHPTALFPPPACRASVSDKGFKYAPDNSWRIKWKVKAYDGPFEGCGKATSYTKSYKKKNNGKWKKHSSTIGTAVYGSIVAWDCTGGTNIDSGYRQKRERKIKRKVPYCGGKVLKESVWSDHYQEKVGMYTHKLTW